MINKEGNPIRSLETWYRLAGPKREGQWKDGRSAKESANAWLEHTPACVPCEITQALHSHRDFGRILPAGRQNPRRASPSIRSEASHPTSMCSSRQRMRKVRS